MAYLVLSAIATVLLRFGADKGGRDAKPRPVGARWVGNAVLILSNTDEPLLSGQTAFHVRLSSSLSVRADAGTTQVTTSVSQGLVE